MLCPQCSGDVPDGDLFCESCGSRLTPEPAPEPCPCTELDEDGFCQQCGRRVLRPATDHIEQALSPDFAAVSDRGLRHDRNEDRFAIAHLASASILVVCDGVSATHKSEIASAHVAESVLASLTAAFASGDLAPEQALRIAIKEAAASLTALTTHEQENPASTTLVAALVTATEATVAWVGDSRAYWIAGGTATLLTRDHSWANEVVATGQMSPEQAARAPQAHAITRWLGADADPDLQPGIVQMPITPPGLLLLCTDGLWNYAQTLDVFHQVVAEAASSSQQAIELAQQLVLFANAAGGQDNVTVALLRAG